MLHLIWFGIVAVTLEIDFFLHARLSEYVMTAFDALLKTEILQQCADIIKPN